MCSRSKVNELLGGGIASSNRGATPMISALQLKHHREKYFVVDIREADEIESDPYEDVDAKTPMGKLLATSSSPLIEEYRQSGKEIVLICSSGRRSAIAASELGSDIRSLSHGIVSMRYAAAIAPDFVVTLGTKSNAEKLTLALNACAVAAAEGSTTVLVLLGDGVCTFLRKGNNKEEMSPTSFRVEETFIGEPFQPTVTLLQKFLSTGNAVILACTSCVKARSIEFGSDLLDDVQPIMMPDLLRMLGEAQKTLQFT
jgi:rhodanese-related sulfurtransferase/predicted peroxiredoxin